MPVILFHQLTRHSLGSQVIGRMSPAEWKSDTSGLDPAIVVRLPKPLSRSTTGRGDLRADP
jgi:hypothetical protein